MSQFLAPQIEEHERGFSHPPTWPAVLSNQFAELLISAGLRGKSSRATGGRRTTSALSFHSLRHTAVSMLHEAGNARATVQEYVGHDSAAMSAVYTHVGTDALKKAAASLPEI